MNRLQELELDEREEELRDLAAALARVATDTGVRISLDELAGKLGVDLDGLGYLDDATESSDMADAEVTLMPEAVEFPGPRW